MTSQPLLYFHNLTYYAPYPIFQQIAVPLLFLTLGTARAADDGAARYNGNMAQAWILGAHRARQKKHKKIENGIFDNLPSARQDDGKPKAYTFDELLVNKVTFEGGTFDLSLRGSAFGMLSASQKRAYKSNKVADKKGKVPKKPLSPSVVFEGSKLEACDAEGAKLEGVRFNSTLEGDRIDKTEQQKEEAACYLHNPRFVHSDISYTYFGWHCALINPLFQNTKLEKVTFGQSSQQEGGEYSGVILQDVHFMPCASLYNVEFKNAEEYEEGKEAEATVFNNVTFGRGCQFQGSSFVDITLNNVVFDRDCGISDVVFNGTVFNNVTFAPGCKLDGAKFVGCTFNNTTFAGCNLETANFEEAIGNKLTFEAGCNLGGAKFDKARLKNVTVTDCSLEGASFKEATFLHRGVVSFLKVDLRGSNFEGVTCDVRNKFL